MSRAPHVFVVDDDEAIREALEMYLQILGVPTQTFPSAEAFLEAYQAEWTGCLLLDLRMPGLGGLALLEELRKRQISMPTAIMTAHNNEDSLPNFSMYLTVIGTLLKPFSIEQLKDVIERRWTKYVDQPSEKTPLE